jgi:Mce-associated membrane protein
MTKSEDDTAKIIEEPTAVSVEPVTEVVKAAESKAERRGWRTRVRRPASPPGEEPTVEPQASEPTTVEPQASEPTVEASLEAVTVEAQAAELTADAPTTEVSVAPAAAETVVAPRIRGASADEDDEPTQIVATDSDDSDVSDAEPFEPDAQRGTQWSRILAFGVLPALALVLALAAGYLKYVDDSVKEHDLASIESVQAAKDSTVALLSYKPDAVEKQLVDARSLLTGDFQQSYTDLTTNVVIPGAKQQQISASARVPAAASVSADAHHAVVLVLVNQTVVIGTGVPSDTASSVRVTLDKVGDKWLISKFDPV